MNRATVRRLPAVALAVVTLVVSAIPAAAGAPPQSQTPTEVFQAYRTVLAKATSFNELLPFMDAKGRGLIEALPEAQRAGMFELMKKFAGTFSDVAVTGEKVTGDSAVLSLSGKDPRDQPATGSVPMTKDASGWKVGAEKWSSKPR
jgi:hypothetical protein